MRKGSFVIYSNHVIFVKCDSWVTQTQICVTPENVTTDWGSVLLAYWPKSLRKQRHKTRFSHNCTLWREFTGHPYKRPVMRGFDVISSVSNNWLLNKHPNYRWFATQWSLCDVTVTTSNGSWCMGIKGEMSGTVCVTFTWYMYIYELFIAFVCFVVCSLL